jgi:hypothetical protein
MGLLCTFLGLTSSKGQMFYLFTDFGDAMLSDDNLLLFFCQKAVAQTGPKLQDVFGSWMR